jgi:hypothetical protein
LQDCFGGCTDPSQGFYGRMDEVGGCWLVGLVLAWCVTLLPRFVLTSLQRRPRVRGAGEQPGSNTSYSRITTTTTHSNIINQIQVRIWKTVRSQEELINHMWWATGLENHKDLVAYWKFNDPDSDDGQFRCVCVWRCCVGDI